MNCSPGLVVADLARLLHSLGLRRAPVVVGHATSTQLAAAFADHIATHACLAVEEPADPLWFGIDPVLAAAGIDHVPAPYQSFARPRRDPLLLAAYRSWLDQPVQRQPVPTVRYRDDSAHQPRCAPLSDPEGLAARIRSLL